MSTTKPRRKTRPSDDRRGDIARAAMAILQDEGYAALTARKIAAVADISLGHISYHFRDMNEVLTEAYRLASEELRRATAEGVDASSDDPLARVRAFLWAGFGAAFMDRCDVRVQPHQVMQTGKLAVCLFDQRRFGHSLFSVKAAGAAAPFRLPITVAVVDQETAPPLRFLI